MAMTKPLQVMMICFILMMMPLAGCLEDTVDSETPEENEDVVEQQDQNEVSVIEGCMTNTSANYNPNATEDDGSCMDLLPKDALIALYESWGAHMFTPIMDSDDPRTGVEFSTKSMTVDLVNSVDTENDESLAREDGIEYGLISALVAGDFTTTHLTVIKDGSGALLLTSYDSTGTSPVRSGYDDAISAEASARGGGSGWAVGLYEYQACERDGGNWVNTHVDPTNNPNVGYCEWTVMPSGLQVNTVSKEIINLDGEIVIRTNGLGNSVLDDGTYVRDGMNTKTSDSRSLMEFVIEESKPLRTPTCDEYYGPGNCGEWPMCYEPVPGTDCDGNSVTPRGGGSGWAVGLYEYQACERDGGNWVNTHVDPTNNPNVGYCEWSVAPLDVVFGTNPVADGFDFLDAKLSEAEIDYDSNDDGITFTYNFENSKIGFKITVDADDHELIAFESVSVTEADNESKTTERFTLNYILETESESEDGITEEVMTRAAPSGTHSHPWLDDDIRDEWGYYHFCGCSCVPSGGLYVYMYYMTAANNIPIICNNACAAACGVSGGPDFPYIDVDLVRGDGVKSGSLTSDATEFIGSKERAPPSLALEFECYHGDDKSATVSLESIQDGVDDCSTSADEDFDSENGVTFVVSEKQIRNPLITSMGVQFMTITENGSSVIEVMNFTLPNMKEGGEESTRAADSGDEGDNSSEREVVYTDVDGDGKISPGDLISVTFPNGEFIQFVDHTNGVTVAIHGEEETTAVIHRAMTCKEEFGNDVCESIVRFYDSSTGQWYDFRMCFLKPSGEDCNGNPISDS